MKYIELFAGCGGMSLGISSAEYDLMFANELSPMAAETYAFNLLSEDLSETNLIGPEKVKWISSNFAQSELFKRLRENPMSFPSVGQGYSDLSGKVEDLDGTLIVGDIVMLNAYLKKHRTLLKQLQKQNIDLVSGGPPCQSFSMAGLRQHDNTRNQMPMHFADFVNLTKPKVAVLENVSGILRAFKIGASKYYAWFEVAKAFASYDYFPLCLHVNAKYVGAAQNRPRFVLIAMRRDIFEGLSNQSIGADLSEALNKTKKFVSYEQSGINTKPFIDLDYYDIEKNPQFFTHEIFNSLLRFSEDKFFSAKEAIDDLKKKIKGAPKNSYLTLLDETFLQLNRRHKKQSKIPNHEERMNSVKVRQRFLLYQYLADLRFEQSIESKTADEIYKNVMQFIKDPSNSQFSQQSLAFLIEKEWLGDDGSKNLKLKNKSAVTQYFSKLSTKKQTQRALVGSRPAPAALSIPDDACHYDKNIQRTLTVREMARFQSFPDWFEFRSKVTTGGKMRSFEVPQYTQVGNAVPPLLGHALGIVVKKIIAASV